MTKWEYCMVISDLGGNALILVTSDDQVQKYKLGDECKLLSQLGSQGWEVVGFTNVGSVYHLYWTLKRQIG